MNPRSILLGMPSTRTARRSLCFVYDPTAQIGHPAGLEQDLSKEDKLKVIEIVAPKH